MIRFNRLIRLAQKGRAVIELLDNGSPIVDCISVSGVTIDGEPAPVQSLQPGDEVQLSGSIPKTLQATRSGRFLKPTIPHTLRQQLPGPHP